MISKRTALSGALFAIALSSASYQFAGAPATPTIKNCLPAAATVNGTSVATGSSATISNATIPTVIAQGAVYKRGPKKGQPKPIDSKWGNPNPKGSNAIIADQRGQVHVVATTPNDPCASGPCQFNKNTNKFTAFTSQCGGKKPKLSKAQNKAKYAAKKAAGKIKHKPKKPKKPTMTKEQKKAKSKASYAKRKAAGKIKKKPKKPKKPAMTKEQKKAKRKAYYAKRKAAGKTKHKKKTPTPAPAPTK